MLLRISCEFIITQIRISLQPARGQIIQCPLSLQRLASDERVKCLDLHTLFLDESGEPNPAFLLDDGVHVSGEDYGIWSSAIEKLFLPLLAVSPKD